jgi:hypothetical protein
MSSAGRHMHSAGLTRFNTLVLQMGLGDLTDGGPTPKGRYNGGQEPWNEAW